MLGEVMTLEEAANYLRLSKSTLYQRKDIPRHRLPRSREVRFFKHELIAWVKSGECETQRQVFEAVSTPLDMAPSTVYHRNARYR
jgi:excisionase family DNA binding protein